MGSGTVSPLLSLRLRDVCSKAFSRETGRLKFVLETDERDADAGGTAQSALRSREKWGLAENCLRGVFFLSSYQEETQFLELSLKQSKEESESSLSLAREYLSSHRSGLDQKAFAIDNQNIMDSRFQEYVECVAGGKKGFRIAGCDFFFQFLEDGGWRDEHGRRFNKFAEPESSSESDQESEEYDSEDEPQDQLTEVLAQFMAKKRKNRGLKLELPLDKQGPVQKEPELPEVPRPIEVDERMKQLQNVYQIAKEEGKKTIKLVFFSERELPSLNAYLKSEGDFECRLLSPAVQLADKMLLCPLFFIQLKTENFLQQADSLKDSKAEVLSIQSSATYDIFMTQLDQTNQNRLEFVQKLKKRAQEFDEFVGVQMFKVGRNNFGYLHDVVFREAFQAKAIKEVDFYKDSMLFKVEKKLIHLVVEKEGSYINQNPLQLHLQAAKVEKKVSKAVIIFDEVLVPTSKQDKTAYAKNLYQRLRVQDEDTAEQIKYGENQITLQGIEPHAVRYFMEQLARKDYKIIALLLP